MRRVAIGLLAIIILSTILEACSSKLCPAYSSYPKARRK
ncbi:MAG: hypothetical protein K0S09_901 [Sphingobacteriaceae bacterium]|jgi:hypothetical protein|nr:hypothetical protein [Sphingobacteriaceae bacterium]